MASKWHLLARATRANKSFMRLFRDSPHPLALFLTRERVELAPLYHIYHAASRELAFYLVGEEEPGRNFSSRLQGAGRITASQMESVQNAMVRAVAEAATRLEMRLPMVATVLGAAPFLGLLGTVWGLMDCFAGLVASGTGAGWEALAPGVAAALLTTLTGLVVAIPSLIGYNMLVSRIRSLVVRMDNFASELSGLFDRHFVDHRTPEGALPSLASMGAPSMPAFSSAPSQPLPTKLSLSESA
ncbi:MAG: MotA/TolQ/ExbB proton channel family protein [Prosthecobacter sp.]|nr:MotA/TolQ/ExbB proton channel family protein [Prosthecobacter sp.]